MMTVIFACLLFYAILSFVTSVTDVCGGCLVVACVLQPLGGRMDKNLLK